MLEVKQNNQEIEISYTNEDLPELKEHLKELNETHYISNFEPSKFYQFKERPKKQVYNFKTEKQVHKNKTGYTGVYKTKSTGKFIASIKRNGVNTYIGQADSAKKANKLRLEYILANNLTE